MGVLGSHVDFEAIEPLIAQTVRREHAAHGALDQTLGMLVAHLLRRLRPQTPRKSAVSMVRFLRPLLAAELHLVGIEHDDVVAVVGVGSPRRLVLAGERPSDAHGERAQALPGRVDHVPIVLGFFRFLLERATYQSHNLGILRDKGEPVNAKSRKKP